MEKELKIKAISKNDFITMMNKVLNETINKGIEYDEAVKVIFTKEEFTELNNQYRTIGQLFGINFIENLLKEINKIGDK